jgi:anti-sigma factor RsiW
MSGKVPQMGCARVTGLIEDLLDGSLEQPLRAAVMEHLGRCQDCARQVERSRKARQVLRRLPRVPADPDLATRVSQAAIASCTSEERPITALGQLERVEPAPKSRVVIAAAIEPEARLRSEMLCRSFADQVEALLEEELEPGLSLAMERHAGQCRECERILESARRARRLLASQPRLEATAEARRRIVAAAEALGERRRRLQRRVAWAATAAAACLALAAGLYGMGGLRGGSEDLDLAPDEPAPMVAREPAASTEEAPSPEAQVAVEEGDAEVAAPVDTGDRPLRRPATARVASAEGVRPKPVFTTRPAETGVAVAAQPGGSPDEYQPPARRTITVASAQQAASPAGPSELAAADGPPSSVGSSDAMPLSL